MSAQPTLSIDLRTAVTDFYFAYATKVDQREMQTWADEFVADGAYTLTTYANSHGKGMYLIYERGRDSLLRRAALGSGYLKAQRNKTLHMISNIRILEVNAGLVSVSAYFAAFRRARDKTSQLQACGEFRDLLDSSAERIRFIEHNVIVDAETLPSNMADLF